MRKIYFTEGGRSMRKDVEEAIKKFKVKTFGNKKNLERSLSNLWEGEEVVYISPTNAIIRDNNTLEEKKWPGIFILTDKRAFFYYKAGSLEGKEAFELSEIKSINCHGDGLTGGHIKIDTVVKSLDILVIYKKDIMKEIQDTIDRTVYNYKNPSNGNRDDVKISSEADEIRKYKNLLDEGIITQEEFEAKKKQILGL